MPADPFVAFRAALLRVRDAEKERDRLAAEAFAVGSTVSYQHGDRTRYGVVTRVHDNRLWVCTEATGATVRMDAERVTGVVYAR